MEKQVLSALEPKSVFHFFEELSRIPRESGNMKAVSDWAVDFAKERGLRRCQDTLGNLHACQLSDLVCALSYDLGVQSAVDQDGLADLVQLVAL